MSLPQNPRSQYKIQKGVIYDLSAFNKLEERIDKLELENDQGI